jgi:hypothetical protein
MDVYLMSCKRMSILYFSTIHMRHVANEMPKSVASEDGNPNAKFKNSILDKALRHSR